MRPPPPVVELKDVERVYLGPPPVVALRGASLTISQGSYIALMGPSGSGKSTLMNILGLLDRPTAGKYLLDGKDTGILAERHRAALRANRIGIVFQAFHLLPWRTAVENVALGMTYSGTRRPVRLAAAYQALEEVGLAHRSGAVPATLSGGEGQRVAIARALVNHPSLMLCDEPTGNLDSGSAATVMDIFDELHSRGLTILMITHDNHVARRASRLLRIADGILRDQ
jgi:putative ABC transport system ATP-binding protein